MKNISIQFLLIILIISSNAFAEDESCELPIIDAENIKIVQGDLTAFQPVIIDVPIKSLDNMKLLDGVTFESTVRIKDSKTNKKKTVTEDLFFKPDFKNAKVIRLTLSKLPKNTGVHTLTTVFVKFPGVQFQQNIKDLKLTFDYKTKVPRKTEVEPTVINWDVPEAHTVKAGDSFDVKFKLKDTEELGMLYVLDKPIELVFKTKYDDFVEMYPDMVEPLQGNEFIATFIVPDYFPEAKFYRFGVVTQNPNDGFRKVQNFFFDDTYELYGAGEEHYLLSDNLKITDNIGPSKIKEIEFANRKSEIGKPIISNLVFDQTNPKFVVGIFGLILESKVCKTQVLAGSGFLQDPKKTSHQLTFPKSTPEGTYCIVEKDYTIVNVDNYDQIYSYEEPVENGSCIDLFSEQSENKNPGTKS